jgi:hypothetical protein
MGFRSCVKSEVVCVSERDYEGKTMWLHLLNLVPASKQTTEHVRHIPDVVCRVLDS